MYANEYSKGQKEMFCFFYYFFLCNANFLTELIPVFLGLRTEACPRRQKQADNYHDRSSERLCQCQISGMYS